MYKRIAGIRIDMTDLIGIRSSIPDSIQLFIRTVEIAEIGRREIGGGLRVCGKVDGEVADADRSGTIGL